MEENLLEKLKNSLEELKEKLESSSDGIESLKKGLDEDTKKNAIDTFSKIVNVDKVSSIVYAVDGGIGVIGSTVALKSNLICLIMAAIEQGIYESIDEIVSDYNKFKDL